VKRSHKPMTGAVAVLATALIAINLRPGATSVGPVLEEVTAGLGIGSGTAGVLTGLPGLCFGLVGATAVGISRRIGVTTGIAAGLALAGTCLVLRGLTDVPWLFLVLSALALAGMAVGNVMVPAWMKAHAPSDNVLLPTVYGTTLIVGGTLGSALTAPAAAQVGWGPALAMWGVLALVSLPLWAWLAVRERSSRPTQAPAPPDPTLRIYRSRTAVALTTLFAVQSMHAYVQFGWLPQIYRDAGLSAGYAGAMLATVTSCGIAGALLMPTVIHRTPSLAPWMLGFAVAMLGGYLGLVTIPATLPWLWALLLGFSGLAFPTILALLTARTQDRRITARLSGFVQPVGYLLAALGPVTVGLLHAATDSWTIPILLLMSTVIPFTWAGLRVSRPVYVDDELATE
jgi:CP family cyanate transporter-like MFS transporter